MKYIFSFIKAVCFFVALSLMANYTYAQTIEVGTINKATSNYDPVIIGEDDELIYVLAEVKSGKYNIEAYEKQNKLKRKYSVSIDHQKIDKKFSVEFERITLMKDQFVVFYSYYDKQSHLYTLFVKTVNKKDGKTQDNRKDLISVEVEKKRRRGDYKVLVPADKSKIFIYHVAYSKVQRKNVRQYMLMNQDLEVLFQKELEEGEFMPRGYIVDNDGSIFYLRYSDMNLYVGSFDANRDYEKWEEQIKFTSDKSLEKYYLHNLEMTISKKNELTVAGLVSEKQNKTKNTTGSAFIVMDRESKEVRVAKINHFNEDFFDQFKTKKDVKKGRDGSVSRGFNREQLIRKSDGSAIMILEEYSTMNYYDRDGALIGREVTYGDLLVINFNADGEMLWANRVPKKQYFSWFDVVFPFTSSTRGLHLLSRPTEWKTTRHFSYSAALFNDKLIVFFNDDIKNIIEKSMQDKFKKFKKPRKAVVAKYEFDLETGVGKKAVFHDALKIQTYLCPRDNFQSGENKDMVIFGIKGGRYCYSILRN
ncbi:MAG: hypothetical protein ACK4ND_19170 [Cytophagaceae bacterium]